MADDFDQQWPELIDGENRLGVLFRQVSSSLDSVLDKARRLGGAFDTAHPFGRSIAPTQPVRAAAGDIARASPAPGGASSAFPALGRGLLAPRDDRTALDNARANQRTAQAVEEMARHGIRLRETPPAVYGE